VFFLVYLRLSFFSPIRQEIGREERLRNDLRCVEWDVKPELNQSLDLATPNASVRPIFVVGAGLVGVSPSESRSKRPVESSAADSLFELDRRQYDGRRSAAAALKITLSPATASISQRPACRCACVRACARPCLYVSDAVRGFADADPPRATSSKSSRAVAEDHVGSSF